jgi:hypothetical protein
MKKGVGSGSISQRYVSGDPDPHKNVTDPQNCGVHAQFVYIPGGGGREGANMF